MPAAFWRAIVWLLATCMTLGVWLFLDASLQQTALADLSRDAKSRLELYYTGLESEVARYDNGSAVLVQDPDVQLFLASAGSARLQARVDGKLDALVNDTQADAAYIVSSAGIVLSSTSSASSRRPTGLDWGEVPMVREALALPPDRSYLTGSVHGRPGFFFVRRIERDGRLVAITLLQTDFEKLEKSWWPGRERAALLDRDGIIVLSSTREWKYKALQQVPERDETAKRLAGRYAQLEITRLSSREVETLDDGGWVLSLPAAHADGRKMGTYVASALTMPETGWTVVALIEGDGPLDSAANQAIASGLAIALLCMVALHLLARRQVRYREAQAHRQLELAYSRLEERVQERTSELQAAHNELLAAQDQLVQAGKLATLGQMAAGITHELNQPLHALNMHCNNALQLNERNQRDGVSRNLNAIRELCERMDRITAQLRGFARKESLRMEAVPLALAVRKSLDVLSPRLAEVGGKVRVLINLATSVRCDAHRLEQVFVNLIGNAIDAAQACPPARIIVSCERNGHLLRVSVCDNGPGISEPVMARLFEPFFTTKPAGHGLGLGLVITASILRAFGTSLHARNRQNGGAAFSFDLEEARHV